MRPGATFAALVATASLALASASPTSSLAARRPPASPVPGAVPDPLTAAERRQERDSQPHGFTVAEPEPVPPFPGARPFNSRAYAVVEGVPEHASTPRYAGFHPAVSHEGLMGDALFAALPPKKPDECPPCNPFNCVLPAFGCLNNGACTTLLRWHMGARLTRLLVLSQASATASTGSASVLLALVARTAPSPVRTLFPPPGHVGNADLTGTNSVWLARRRVGALPTRGRHVPVQARLERHQLQRCASRYARLTS